MNHRALGNAMPSQPIITNPHHGLAPTSSSLDDSMGQQPPLSRSDIHLSHSAIPIETRRATGSTLAEARMEEIVSDSDDESVHLTMQLDTDSESEG